MVAFYVLRLVIPQQEIAGTLAALVLGGGAYMQREIERRMAQPPGPVLKPAEYTRPWFLILATGTAFIGLAQAAVPYVQLRGGPDTAIISSIDSLLRILPPGAAAIVGVVAGQRSDRFGIGVSVGAVVAGWLLSLATIGFVIAIATDTPLEQLPPDAGGPPIFGPPGAEAPPDPVPGLIAGQPLLSSLVASQLPLLTAAALLGYWYGARTRQQAYLGGLLREVGPADRQAIVELAYEAARETRASSAEERVGETAARDPGEDK